MTLYAALDVSVRTVAICIVDQDGAIRLERSVRCELPDILRVLGDFGEPLAKVGFEAGVMTQHLTYGLRAAGYEVVFCMEARQVSAALAAMHTTRPTRTMRVASPRSCAPGGTAASM